MQLSMTISSAKAFDLPQAIVPEGYALRQYEPGDEESWLALIQTGDFANWDMDRLVTFLEPSERREGSRVVAFGNKIVAATFASRREPPQNTGVLDYVVSHPDHRGFGLGRAVCTSVLEFLVERGYDDISLHTDDWRLPAIGLYISLGFDTDVTREDMPARWQAIADKLGLALPPNDTSH